jgi:hypothetical protein
MGKLIVVLSLVVLLIPGVASANLLTNGNFENAVDGDHTAGWSAASPDGWNPGNQAGVGDNPQNGSWNLRNYNDGGMKQEVVVTPGQAYQLKGYAWVPSGSVATAWGSYIGLKFLTSTGATISGSAGSKTIDMKALPRDQYNLGDTGFMVAPSNAAKARIIFGTYAAAPDYLVPGSSDFDNFDFSPVPEPMSMLLLGSGLVGFVGLTRKKN